MLLGPASAPVKQSLCAAGTTAVAATVIAGDAGATATAGDAGDGDARPSNSHRVLRALML